MNKKKCKHTNQFHIMNSKYNCVCLVKYKMGVAIK